MAADSLDGLEGRCAFFATIPLATTVGVAIDFSPIDPDPALLENAVINSVTAIPSWP